MSNAMQRLQNQIQNQQQNQPMPGEQLVAQGATMQRIQTQFHTAVRVQVPRDKKDVLRRILEECDIMPEGLMYSWTVKSKDGTRSVIEGPSIRMAMTMAREYGNCVVNAQQVAEDPKYWTFEGVFLDLETGFTCTRLFRQSKDVVRGKYDQERKLDMAFQIGQSKAIRNAVVNAMPGAIVLRAQEAAKKALAAQLTEGGLRQGIQRMVKAFGRFNVKPKHLEARLGKQLADFTADDIAELRNVFSALEDGQSNAEQEFDMIEEAKEDLGKALKNGSGKSRAKKTAGKKAAPAVKKEQKPKPKQDPEPDLESEPAPETAVEDELNEGPQPDARSTDNSDEPPSIDDDDIPEDI